MKNKRSRNKIPEETERTRNENLRGQNQRLRKEVQRLRKENEKLRGRDAELVDLLQDDSPTEKMLDIEKTLNCPECGSQHIRIITKLRGDIDYYFCDSCPAKGPIK